MSNRAACMDDGARIRARQDRRAGRHALGRSVVSRMTSTGLPTKCLILDPARVGQHQPATRHERDKVPVALRRDKPDVRQGAKLPVDVFSTLG